MSRKQFSKSDIKKFLEEFPPAELVMNKKSDVAEDNGVLFVGKEACFINNEGEWFPTLKLILKNPDKELIPKLIVDMGAVRFVANGADIMRPGVVGCGNFKKGAIVLIVDETHEKPLGIGKALFSSEDLMNQTEGKVVKSLHYVGDEYWNTN